MSIKTHQRFNLYAEPVEIIGELYQRWSGRNHKQPLRTANEGREAEFEELSEYW